MYFPEDLRTWHEHGKWADLCRSTSPRLLSTVPPQPTQSWIGAATWSGFRVGKAKNRRAWAGHVNCSVVVDPFSVHLWSSKLSAGRELLASTTSSQKAEGSRDAPGLAMEAVVHVQPSPSEHSECCDAQEGNVTYLIGSSDESEDVDLRIGLHIITEQGVEMRDGGQRAVLIGHTVQIPGRRNESGVTGRSRVNESGIPLHLSTHHLQTLHIKTKD